MVDKATAEKIIEDIKSGKLSGRPATDAIMQLGNVQGISSATSSVATQSDEAVKRAANSAAQLGQAISNVGSKYGDLILKGTLLSTDVRDLTASVKEAGNNIYRYLQPGLDSASASAELLQSKFATVAKAMNLPFDLEGAKKLAQSGEYARSLENSMITLANATGNFDGLLKSAGKDLSNLDQVAMKFDQQNFKTAQSTGLLKSEVEKTAIELGKVPGVLDESFKTSAGVTMTSTQAIITLSRATGQNQEDVAKKVKKAYEDFNMTGKQFVTIQSQIAMASRDLKMPFEAVADVVSSMADAFRKFGDNTGSSVKMLNQIVPALDKVGVSQRQIGEISNSLAQNFASMGTAQRAFLSQQAGGPGGLRGAMQIENMMMKGDAAGVAKMAEEAMRKRFGGRVVGFEEAQRSQGAAAQFERQRQLLSSGAFGLKLEGTEATKFLDAMSKGKVFDVTKAGRRPEEALAETMKTGNAILEKNKNAVTLLTNEIIQNTSVMQSFLDSKLLREGTGTSGAARGYIDRRSKDASAEAVSLTREQRISLDDLFKRGAKELSTSVTDAKTALISSGSAAVAGISKILQEAKERYNLKEGSKELGNLKERLLSTLDPSARKDVESTLRERSLLAKYIPASKMTAEAYAGGALDRAVEAARPKGEAGARQEGRVGQQQAITVLVECPDCHKKHLKKTISEEVETGVAAGLRKAEADRAKQGVTGKK